MAPVSSTSIHFAAPVGVAAAPVPRLEPGDRLSRDEFERRYEAMPEVKKAELVEGVVYMGSPVRAAQHAEPDANLAGWLFTYKSQTPGVLSLNNATVRLDKDNEPQPDCLLMVESARGGQATIGAQGVRQRPARVGRRDRFELRQHRHARQTAPKSKKSEKIALCWSWVTEWNSTKCVFWDVSKCEKA